MDYSTMWLIAGVLMIVLEFAVPGFIIFFWGVGGIIVGLLLLALDLPIYAQWGIFCVSSIVLLLAFRRFMPRVFGGREEQIGDLPPDDLECAGKSVEVVVDICPGKGGKVFFQGGEWNAVSDKEHRKGEYVRIVKRDNITLVVE